MSPRTQTSRKAGWDSRYPGRHSFCDQGHNGPRVPGESGECRARLRLVVKVVAQALGACRVTEFAHCFGLDLADPFAG